MWSTAWCSIWLVIRCLPFAFLEWATPLMARLSDSVPPEVNSISLGEASIREATFSLASLMACLASYPHLCTLEALPNLFAKYGNMAASTSGLTGVVAEWSR